MSSLEFIHSDNIQISSCPIRYNTRLSLNFAKPNIFRFTFETSKTSEDVGKVISEARGLFDDLPKRRTDIGLICS